MLKNVVIVLASIVVGFGCSTTQGIYPAYQASDKEAKARFDEAVDKCNRQAKDQYPKLVQYIPNGKIAVTPLKTNCSTYKNETSCTSSGGSPYADYDVIDANYPKRSEAFYECLEPLGYKKQQGAR